MSAVSSNTNDFRRHDLPKYAPDVDHPFKMYRTAENRLGFSYGLVRGALSFGMPAFTPQLDGTTLRSPAEGQLTTTPSQVGRWFLELQGVRPSVASITPRNLQVLVPTAGQVKHESDVVFGDPMRQLVLIGHVNSNGTINQFLRSDISAGDMFSTPYDGPPQTGPDNPDYPDESGNGAPQYGGGGMGEGGITGLYDGVFNYGE